MNINNRWIPFYKPKPQAQLRLFCFPHAGGGASAYRLWPGELPPEIDVCSVQLPGRENRVMDPPLNDIDSLLKALATALLPYFDIPNAFFGHSFGSLISFELGRYLRKQYGQQPIHLFVSGYQAPPIANKLPPMSHLPDHEFVAQLSELRFTPEAVFEHDELVKLLLPALRADFTLYEKYRYRAEEQLDCPISAFGGRKDELVFEEDLRAWNTHTKAPFKMQMFAGDHFYLHGSDRRALLDTICVDLLQHLNGKRQT